MVERQFQTFQLNSPLQLLIKLVWNVKQLRSSVRSSDKAGEFFPTVYKAFDCAITAWQLADWVWASVQDKGAILSKVPTKYAGRKPLAQFQALICDENKYLRICRHIADSNKHFGVDHRPDPKLKVSVEWTIESEFAAGSAAGSPLVDRSYRLVVNDSGQEYEALEVMKGALEFWAKELGEQSILQLLDD
ncbi:MULTISPECIES: hypothetical protein [Pseudomonas syringae group]|uniref:hypothetical protein n=1 Tax=Pseudomonas syringae group TaxID=136849 RepID=UPI000F00DBC4|nr:MULTISPECIES: hypothetical protein [Pseudomonas syringae group]MCK0547876.1 hypothetical protein [Pseudomonas syringae pv. aptata]